MYLIHRSDTSATSHHSKCPNLVGLVFKTTLPRRITSMLLSPSMKTSQEKLLILKTPAYFSAMAPTWDISQQKPNSIK